MASKNESLNTSIITHFFKFNSEAMKMILSSESPDTEDLED